MGPQGRWKIKTPREGRLGECYQDNSRSHSFHIRRVKSKPKSIKRKKVGNVRAIRGIHFNLYLGGEICIFYVYTHTLYFLVSGACLILCIFLKSDCILGVEGLFVMWLCLLLP